MVSSYSIYIMLSQVDFCKLYIVSLSCKALNSKFTFERNKNIEFYKID